MTEENKILPSEETSSDVKINDSEEKLYTQKELEKIVEQRLIRERKNAESFREIRDLLGELRKRGDIKEGSNAQIACSLAKLLHKDEEAKEDSKTEENSASPDTLPESVKNADFPRFSEVVQKDTPEVSNSADEFYRFIEKFGENELKAAMNDKAFTAFSAGKEGSLSSLYEGYLDFLSALSESRDARKYRAAEASLASTGFSKRASGEVDYGSLLTENQKKLAKGAGMSYRQYSELLSQIPTKKLKK